MEGFDMNSDCRKYTAYIGTYTGSGSEGIYIFSLDTANGILEPAGVLAGLENPSYLAVDSNCRYLYAALETDEFKGEQGGAVGAFSIDRQTGGLRLINCRSTKGKAPCHLSTDIANRYLFAANYSEGTITVFRILPDGSAGPITCIVKHQGTGPDAGRQEMPHVHYVTLTPDEKYLCAVDLGIDKMMVYDFDHASGRLTPAESLSTSLRPGSGPRHMEFHPDGKYAYIVDELDSNIVVLRYLPEEYRFEKVQHISALPGSYSGTNYPAAIHLSPDGNYLYASNRGYDSIAVFGVDKASGSLEPVSHMSTHGEFPRDFAIDPTGRYLFAANQKSDTIVSLLLFLKQADLSSTAAL
jgi:6-phosphogluconolactonase